MTVRRALALTLVLALVLLLRRRRRPEPAPAAAAPAPPPPAVATSAAPELRLFEVADDEPHRRVAAALAAAIDVIYLDPQAFTDMPDSLLEIAERLERAAQELRRGDLDAARAAELVDECARLAGEAGSELDRRVRAGDAPPGQLTLGG